MLILNNAKLGNHTVRKGFKYIYVDIKQEVESTFKSLGIKFKYINVDIKQKILLKLIFSLHNLNTSMLILN